VTITAANTGFLPIGYAGVRIPLITCVLRQRSVLSFAHASRARGNEVGLLVPALTDTRELQGRPACAEDNCLARAVERATAVARRYIGAHILGAPTLPNCGRLLETTDRVNWHRLPRILLASADLVIFPPRLACEYAAGRPISR